MNSSIDQQFVEFIIMSLVNKPEAVSVARTIDEKGVLLELTVDPEDLGRVIGKRGATAQSLRTLLRALGTKNDSRYNLKIIDNGEAYVRPERPERADAPAPATTTVSDDVMADDVAVTSPTTPATDHDDALARTRKELEGLDDLDI